MINYQIVIIGGGPAGLAAAVSSYEHGERNILILERDEKLGGILNQCIHNGFGLHTFKEELTGPEYAQKYIDLVNKYGIEYKLNTAVLEINRDKTITAVNSKDGLLFIKAKAIILSCGARERSRGGINVPGDRSSGIFSAGTAQKLINIEGKKIGKTAVILGSGDIGLIMARRLTLEGCLVKAVIELMNYSSGLNRNIVQCLNDFDIPLYFSHTITSINGKNRIKSVTVCQVDNNLKPILDTSFTIECDTLLLSVGLIPENEISSELGIDISQITNGANVDENMMTSIDGIFSCGNMLHIHDLVDYVSLESAIAGKNAVRYINNQINYSHQIQIKTTNGIRYVVPQLINFNQDNNEITFKLRVNNVYKNCYLALLVDEEIVLKKYKKILTPGEMELLIVSSDVVKKIKQSEKVEITLIGGETCEN